MHLISARVVFCAAIVAALLPVFVPPGYAQFSTDYQTNIISGVVSNWTGDYIVGSNTVFDLLRIENGGSVVASNIYVSFDSSASGNSLDVVGGNLYATNGTICVANSGVGEMIISDGTVFANKVMVASNTTAQGTLTLAGGTLTILSTVPPALEIGWQSGATGMVLMTGGELTATNNVTAIGDAGVGQMTVSNGIWRAKRVSVGLSSLGTLTVAGGIHSLSELNVGGSASTNSVWLTGGQLNVSDTYLGFNSLPPGVGQMTVSNGTWEGGSANVGFGISARGTLTVAGGVHILAGLFIGNSSNASGTVWLTGGQLTVTNGTLVGMDGIGGIIVSNGIWSTRFVVMPRPVIVGGSGTLTIAGGTSSVYSNLTLGIITCKFTGTVSVTGGNLFVTNSAASAVVEVRGGTFTVSGGNVVIDKLVVTNACGRFIHSGGNLVVGSLVLDPNLDADGDGLPNGWEQSHGLGPLNAADANMDSDGDGFTNLQEFRAGTDSTNSTSAFRILSIVPTNDDVLVSWMAGGGRTNAVQSATDLTGNYTNVSPNIILPGSGDVTTNYLDAGGATNTALQFYRIRLVP